jgi:pilus assembly protein Flp/PilA
MKSLTMKAIRFFREENGVTSIEYALIASLIAIIIVGAVTGVGKKLVDIFTNIEGQFP